MVEVNMSCLLQFLNIRNKPSIYKTNLKSLALLHISTALLWGMSLIRHYPEKAGAALAE